MSTGRTWNVDLRAGSVDELTAMVNADATIPENVKFAIGAAIGCLPVREDLGVMVNTSGRQENWEEYTALVKDIPEGVPLPPKPSGFMSLWVGHTNTLHRTVVS